MNVHARKMQHNFKMGTYDVLDIAGAFLKGRHGTQLENNVIYT